MSEWAGNLIRLGRQQQGLSQRELARRAKTSQTAIAAIETGKRSPSLDTLARVIRAAGLDLRIRLEPADDHDDWVRLYESRLPARVKELSRERDRRLMAAAGKGLKASKRSGQPDSQETAGT
ncbi:MAG: helix-turn-helix transcriptional regulator [Actinomycetota bacterium]|nr:helix-turn-helix domain-containing protein [Actinomycetota bacterium]